jgi:hypothetical protein
VARGLGGRKDEVAVTEPQAVTPGRACDGFVPSVQGVGLVNRANEWEPANETQPVPSCGWAGQPRAVRWLRAGARRGCVFVSSRLGGPVARPP